jgi:hypothetical protein
MFENLVATVGHDHSKTERKDDFTIIIPHRGDPMGLWATVHGCESAMLSYASHKYSYVIVANGMDEIPENTFFLKEGLEAQGKLSAFIHVKSPLAPPEARQLGADAATGEILFFFDNHCIPEYGYFEEMLAYMDKYDLLHSTTQYWTGKYKHYHYPLTLEDNFWVTNPAEHPVNLTAYDCACGGAGGFAVRKAAFDSAGGYGHVGLFKGWGGEETYLDLKLWMFGFRVGVNPFALHWHYASQRSYDRHNTPEFYQNLMTAAYVLGGDKWLDKVAASFDKPEFKDIITSRKEHRDWIAANAKYTLDEVLEKFKREGIAH